MGGKKKRSHKQKVENMFLWIVFWLAFIIGVITLIFFDLDYDDGALVAFLISGLTVIIVGFVIIGFMFNGFSDKQALHSKVVSISTKSVQRDGLVNLLQGQLDEYPNFAKDVASALDAKIIIAVYPILGSDVYLAKTNQIVNLNVDIASAYNQYYQLQADICSNQGNAMVPKTVWYPDCQIANWDQLKLPPLKTVNG